MQLSDILLGGPSHPQRSQSTTRVGEAPLQEVALWRRFSSGAFSRLSIF